MAYFSIPLELIATIYIQARTQAHASVKLQEILNQPLDANDWRWFSDASFDSDRLPELSFATAMTIGRPKPGATFESIALESVNREMISNPEGYKSRVLPRSQVFLSEANTPIYWADLDVEAVGILRAESFDDVKSMKIDDVHIHWELADDWFTLNGLDNDDLPMILSPNMTVKGVVEGIPLRIRWDGYARTIDAE